MDPEREIGQAASGLSKRRNSAGGMVGKSGKRTLERSSFPASFSSSSSTDEEVPRSDSIE